MGRLSKRELLTEKKTESKKKKQTMKKKLLKPRLLSFAAFCGLVLAFSSCANEDIAQKTPSTGNENDKNLTTFVAGDEAKTRTTMDYNTGAFYWEAGDYIYVKDDDNVWQKSNNAPSGKVASFKFKVPGKFTKGNTYKVYYPGKNGNQDQVTIPAAQTQTTPNTTDHFGVSGDCGTADASWSNAKNGFAFALDHQAAILVFLPYTNNTALHNCFLTKIEVISNNNITNTYTLNSTTGELTGTGSGNQIILTTTGSGSYANGFPLNTTSANITTNGAYMIIKPGTHILKIRYWVKDIVTNVEGTVTKTLNSFNYVKNTYYDMIANLNVKDYDGNQYYMWDAQKQYWDGYEWTKNLSNGQPTLISQPASNNYAQNSSDLRYFHQGSGSPFNATTTLFQSLPNANEMSWYCMYGDPRWDEDELWTSMGHLHKGGMWVKKKSVLQAENHFNTEKSADGITDMRTTQTTYINNSLTPVLPSTADANKYFYLPALGYYGVGALYGIGFFGYFWSSNACPSFSGIAYSMFFQNTEVKVSNSGRYYGCRAQPFSDFGDN